MPFADVIVQPDGLLEKDGAIGESLLLKANRAEHGVCGSSRRRIRERQSRLQFCLVEPSLLNEARGVLKRSALLGSRGGALTA